MAKCKNHKKSIARLQSQKDQEKLYLKDKLATFLQNGNRWNTINSLLNTTRKQNNTYMAPVVLLSYIFDDFACKSKIAPFKRLHLSINHESFGISLPKVIIYYTLYTLALLSFLLRLQFTYNLTVSVVNPFSNFNLIFNFDRPLNFG